MGRVLLVMAAALICVAIGYAVGRARNRGEDTSLTQASRDRDSAYLALQTAHSALRSALQDPNLTPATTITLDDARQVVFRALPKELRP